MSLAPYDNLERRELERLAAGELRLVHSQRARKLRKLGEYVWWNYGVCGLVWEPARSRRKANVWGKRRRPRPVL